MNNQLPNDAYESMRLKELMVNLSEDVEENLIEDLMVLGDRPEVLSLLIYKLAKEREKTNAMIKELNAKYDKILSLLREKEINKEVDLSEQEEQILELISEKNRITAKEVQDAFAQN